MVESRDPLSPEIRLDVRFHDCSYPVSRVYRDGTTVNIQGG